MISKDELINCECELWMWILKKINKNKILLNIFNDLMINDFV